MKIAFAHPVNWPGWSRAALALACALACGGPAFAACGVAGASVAIAEVTERLEIRLADGRLARLAGLDLPAPRRGEPETTADARTFLTSRLAGREAALVAFAAKPDRWGRWLVDFRLPDLAEGNASAAKMMVSQGFARVKPEFETRSCVAERLAAEREARAAGLGLWNDPDYSILDAVDREELAHRDGRFVLVEGTVRRVGFGRARLYLDFGGRDGFTVIVARKSQNAFQNAGVPLGALAGENVRVRGVLDDRFGPRLEVAEPLMIERLGRAEANQGTGPGG
jgi:endonuclease YncB( thermonuclease family)